MLEHIQINKMENLEGTNPHLKFFLRKSPRNQTAGLECLAQHFGYRELNILQKVTLID